MGFFNIFKSKKKHNIIEIFSPLNGKIITLEEVPDEAFSQKMIGDGCAIEPTEGAIYSPIDAQVDIFDTNHAISFETKDELEMIVHFGIDTVKLNSQGLKRVNTSDEVSVGDKLIEYDLDFIKKNAKSTKTPIIITSMDIVENIEVVAKGNVKVGDLLMKITLK
ncbi:MAG: PTS sugar transporter subunit IIA [Fusobacterium sp.]